MPVVINELEVVVNPPAAPEQSGAENRPNQSAQTQQAQQQRATSLELRRVIRKHEKRQIRLRAH